MQIFKNVFFSTEAIWKLHSTNMSVNMHQLFKMDGLPDPKCLLDVDLYSVILAVSTGTQKRILVSYIRLLLTNLI